MIRILLSYILPLAFPFVVYFLWMKLRRSTGDEDGEPKKDPWFWLFLSGFALMALGLSYTALTGDKITDGTYRPDRYEDGRIIPGEVKPTQE